MKKKKLFLAFVILSLIFAVIVERADFSSPVRSADLSRGWELMLLNENYKVPEDFEIELITLSCGERVEKRIYPHLQKMFDTALSEGVDLVVRSGFRSEEEQKAIMINKIGEFRSEGFSKRKAAEKARQWVSMPGTSEHQLGLAVDINAENKTTDETAYKWLSENAHKYGFILRYPSDKSHITGVSYEPWHYRYVGEEHAGKIYSSKQCLEEYLENF